MIEQTVESRDPRELKNHLLSIRIYGQDKPSEDFLQSIRDEGITHPILILPDGTIISGHTRKLAAVILGLKEVPVLVRHDLVGDTLRIERLVIQSNRQRTKTGDILAREASALATIESAYAEIRQKSGCRDLSMVPCEGTPKGRTDDKVAEALGVGRSKAANAIVVGDAIRKAEEAGDTETAERISNEARKSIASASRLVKGKDAKPADENAPAIKGVTIPDKLVPVFLWREKFRAYDKVHGPAIAELAVGAAYEFFEGGDGPLDYKKIGKLLDEVHGLLMPWQPESVCKCGGEPKCKLCSGRGWIRKGSK